MEDKTAVAITGIVCVTALELANLYFKGPDSTVIGAVVGAITFIVGLAFGKVLK